MNHFPSDPFYPSLPYYIMLWAALNNAHYLNNVFDAVTEDKRDDKLALIYDINKVNKVAVNTTVGQTERFSADKIVTQGGTWGSLKCSNHIDALGRRCSSTGEYMYTYKNQVEVLPLAMVDELLGIASCGHNSLALNTFINTKIELKFTNI